MKAFELNDKRHVKCVGEGKNTLEIERVNCFDKDFINICLEDRPLDSVNLGVKEAKKLKKYLNKYIREMEGTL